MVYFLLMHSINITTKFQFLFLLRNHQLAASRFLHSYSTCSIMLNHIFSSLFLYICHLEIGFQLILKTDKFEKFSIPLKIDILVFNLDNINIILGKLLKILKLSHRHIPGDYDSVGLRKSLEIEILKKTLQVILTIL